MVFKNRVEAGEKLADKLEGKFKDEGLVLGIPRGGVVAGRVLADKLNWNLDVLITKKIGFPGQSELAMGAVAEDGKAVWDEQLAGRAGNEEKKIELSRAQKKVTRYIEEFRDGKKLRVKDKTVIIVDDGIATGKTMEAGIKWLRGKGVGKIVAAVPVCAKDTAKKLKRLVDEWVCLDEPRSFMAVGQFYREFSQVDDEEVKELLVE